MRWFIEEKATSFNEDKIFDGVIFDSKLTWSKHISKQTNKANSALHAIKLIRKFFNQSEILTLLTANFYSILFYNSEVWHIPKLKPELKQIILSCSANALKLSQRQPDIYESFINVHKSCKRALPEKMLMYKHAILLHKVYNNENPNSDTIDLYFNQQFNNRCRTVKFVDTRAYNIGKNILSNRFVILNGKINLDWLNLPFESYKIKCKKFYCRQISQV